MGHVLHGNLYPDSPTNNRRPHQRNLSSHNQHKIALCKFLPEKCRQEIVQEINCREKLEYIPTDLDEEEEPEIEEGEDEPSDTELNEEDNEGPV